MCSSLRPRSIVELSLSTCEKSSSSSSSLLLLLFSSTRGFELSVLALLSTEHCRWPFLTLRSRSVNCFDKFTAPPPPPPPRLEHDFWRRPELVTWSYVLVVTFWKPKNDVILSHSAQLKFVFGLRTGDSCPAGAAPTDSGSCWRANVGSAGR